VAAFALYILSILTFMLLAYLFLIRPCCIGKRSEKSQDGVGPAGMMVLPVSVPGTGKKGKKGKWKKGEGGGAEGVQVNLIVDPGVFGPREEEPNSQDEYDDSTVGPSSNSHPSRTPLYSHPKPGARSRKSIFTGLAQENQWREARAWLKKMLWVDIVGTCLWGTLFVLILMGKRCPVGQFDGW
jgi:hypothetical protein